MKSFICVLTIISAGCAVSPSLAASPDLLGDVAAGQILAERVCSECHDVRSRNAAAFSPTAAPTFYLVANGKTTTAIGLSVFLQTPHANMPSIILAEDQRRDVISYILGFREPR